MTSKSTYAFQIKVTRADLLLLASLGDQCDDAELKDGVLRVFEKAERAAERITTNRGINVNRFFDICREELGERMIMPPDPAPSWYTKMSTILRTVGVKEDNQARAIAIYAAKFLPPRISLTADRLVYNASEYLGLARIQGITVQPEKPRGIDE